MPDREKVIRHIIAEIEIAKICKKDFAQVDIDMLSDALALLKEQEAVMPISEHHLFLCPVCKNTLFREQKFCHECGKRIEWEGR